MKHRTVTWLDLLAIAVCGLIVMSLTINRVTHYRAAAREASCVNNLKMIGLALHNYHSAYKRLPMGSGGTYSGSDDEPELGNAGRLGMLAGLTPFMEQQALWEMIANPMRANDGTIFPAMGPLPTYDPEVYKPWGLRPAIYVCPADMEDALEYSTASSYVGNYGDGVDHVGYPMNLEGLDGEPANIDVARERASKRGIFHRSQWLRFRDVLDGLSNTLFVSESLIGGPKVAKGVKDLAFNPSLCISARKLDTTKYWPDGREACWADGSLLSTGFQTILPPNSPSATTGDGKLEGVMSVSSNHDGGVHVLFADGRVMFVTNSIDAGDPTTPSVALIKDDARKYTPPGSESPYGLWGALGTRANRERIGKSDAIIEPPKELTDLQKKAMESVAFQEWTSADGKSSFKAKLVNVEGDSHVILLTEEDKTRRIALSDLASEDAYRAVAEAVEAGIKAEKALARDLEQAVTLLEKRDYEKFLKDFFGQDDADPRIVELIGQQRGILIFQLETTIRAIKTPDSGVSVETDAAGTEVEIGFRSTTRLGNLRLRWNGKSWMLTR